MTDFEKLLACRDEKLLCFLKELYRRPESTLGELQKALGVGYPRIGRLRDALPRKYRMVLGADGRLHRQYLPLGEILSKEEICKCIELLEERGAQNAGT